MNATLKPTRYNDKWIYYFICPCIALLSVHVGNDNTFKTLLSIPSYYSDLLLAFTCTYLTVFYIKSIFQKYFINQKWNRKNYLMIIFLGVLTPTSIIMIVESLYLLYLLQIPISSSSIFYLELPLVFTFCLLVNLLYINLSHSVQKNALEENLSIQKANIIETMQLNNFKFLVYSGSKTIVIAPSIVAYIMLQEKNTFIVTKNNKDFLYNSTLNKIQKKLDSKLFFRLNRKVIVRRDAVQSFERLESRRLKVNIFPEPNEAIFVSKNNASRFQKWLHQK